MTQESRTNLPLSLQAKVKMSFSMFVIDDKLLEWQVCGVNV